MKKGFLISGAVVFGLAVLLAAALFVSGGVANAATQFNRVLERAGVTHPFSRTLVTGNGIVIDAIVKDSPADKAGVKRGDILLKVDDKDVNSPADLEAILSSHKPGDSVKLTVAHGDQQNTLTVTLGDENGQPYLGILMGGRVGRKGGPDGGRGGMFPGGGYSGTKPFSGTVPFSSTGVIVVEVVSGGPADKAGVMQGDLITAIDGKTIDQNQNFADLISAHKPGDNVTLAVQHKGTATATATDVKVTLGDNPNQAGTAYLGISYMPAFHGKRGMGGQFPNGQFPQGSVIQGAVVNQVVDGSPASKAGLQVGDTITAIDGKSITTAQELVSAIAAHKVGDSVTLSVEHKGTTTSTDVKVTLGDNPNQAGTAYLGVSLGGGMRGPGPGQRNPRNVQPGQGTQGGSNRTNPSQQTPLPSGSTL